MPKIVDDIWEVVARRLSNKRRTDVRSVVHVIHNFLDSTLHLPSYLSNRTCLSRIEENLEKLAAGGNSRNNETIPPIIHFVYGFKQAEELPYYAYMAVLSALHYNPGWTVIFHYHIEPTGSHWHALKELVTLNKIENFERFGIARIHHYAHKADIVRLLALKHIGGTYLDIDTLTAKSFAPLQSSQFVMGVQADLNHNKGGLCNAAILSKPMAPFLLRWLSNYKSFHSKGRDYLWDFHSVKLPALLSHLHPNELTVLGHDAFFYPLWLDIERILVAEGSVKWLDKLNGSYLFHLWNGYTENILLTIDEKFVRNSTSAYAAIARKALVKNK